MPSAEEPLTGGCACGAVRFRVTAPFETAGYCHCHRCQRRTGSLFGLSGIVPREDFAVTKGADAVRTWRPSDGLPKSFCGECGGHPFAGDPDGDVVVVRLGALDGDPGIRPQWHAWTSSMPAWDTLPDDGLPRHERSRPA